MGRSVCNIVVRLICYFPQSASIYHGVYINLFRTYICDEINTMEALFFMSPLQIFMGSMQAFCTQGLKTTNLINTGYPNHLLQLYPRAMSDSQRYPLNLCLSKNYESYPSLCIKIYFSIAVLFISNLRIHDGTLQNSASFKLQNGDISS